MAGISLAQAQAKLDSYLAAETAVLGGQRYKIADRELQRATLETIQAGVETWNLRVIQLSNSAAGRSRVRTVVVGG